MITNTEVLLNYKTKKTKLPLLCLVAVSAFFFSTLTGGIEANAVEYSASITTSGAQSINVSPGADGGVGTSVSADSVTVNTTCRAGYNLTLSTSVDDNNLYLDGDSSKNASGTYFAPVSGATALRESPNTWGYLLSETIPDGTSVFRNVPTANSPITIKSPLATPSETDINDSFNVYYGVAVANSMTPGKYKMIPDANNSNADGTIVYRLTMADACVAYTVNFSPTSYFEGRSLSGTGTVGDQTMIEGVAMNLTSSKFAAPAGFYFAGWNTAPDGTGITYASGESVTDMADVGETVTLYAMWTDCPENKICYDKTVSVATGTMDNQSVTSNSDVLLSAPNFASGDPTNTALPANYGFVGWSPVKIEPDDAEFRTKLAGLIDSGKIYGPNATINIGTVSPGGKKLYAVWMPVEKDADGKELTFQTANLFSTNLADTTGGATLTEKANGYITALRDYRDNQVYAVAKLADGKYWMVENLRLESPYTVGNNQNDPTITNESLAQGYYKYTGTGTNYGDFVGLADPETTTFLSGDANSLYSSDGSNGTININSSNYPSYRMPRYSNVNTLDSAPGYVIHLSTTYAHGNYYTWNAAAANTAYYDSQAPANYSICPAGWRLPRGGDKSMAANNDFWQLMVASTGAAPANTSSSSQPYYANGADGAMASQAFRAFPNNFVLSGIHDRSNHRNQGSNGVYWTSTLYYSLAAYGVDFSDTSVIPATKYGATDYGESVRCMQGL